MTLREKGSAERRMPVTPRNQTRGFSGRTVAERVTTRETGEGNQPFMSRVTQSARKSAGQPFDFIKQTTNKTGADPRNRPHPHDQQRRATTRGRRKTTSHLESLAYSAQGKTEKNPKLSLADLTGGRVHVGRRKSVNKSISEPGSGINIFTSKKANSPVHVNTGMDGLEVIMSQHDILNTAHIINESPATVFKNKSLKKEDAWEARTWSINVAARGSVYTVRGRDSGTVTRVNDSEEG